MPHNKDETMEHNIIAHHTELAPHEDGCNAWYGYEITNTCEEHERPDTFGWVAKVMHYRTIKWHVSHNRPVANRPSSVIDMTQFVGGDGPGHTTLKSAIDALLRMTDMSNAGKYKIKYQR